MEFTENLTVETRSLDSWATENALVRGGRRTRERARYLSIETSETEFHEGQVTTAVLLSLLPDWRVLARFTFDVLLANRRWRGLGRR
ncbi:MAG: hypothetical protein FGM58_09500 [Acidimicrobiia bacterium]|nr:hypothetical protein [Acidimicrobiia bacterium]